MPSIWKTFNCRRCGSGHHSCRGIVDDKGVEYVVCDATLNRINVLPLEAQNRVHDGWWLRQYLEDRPTRISEGALSAVILDRGGLAYQESVSVNLPVAEAERTVVAIPLIWSECKPPNQDSRYDHTWATTPIGRYMIEWRSWKPHDSYDLSLRGEYFLMGVRAASTLEEAKRMAQQHFQETVAACVLP